MVVDQYLQHRVFQHPLHPEQIELEQVHHLRKIYQLIHSQINLIRQ